MPIASLNVVAMGCYAFCGTLYDRIGSRKYRRPFAVRAMGELVDDPLGLSIRQASEKQLPHKDIASLRGMPRRIVQTRGA